MPQETEGNTPPRRDDPAKIVVVANAALVGVPAAYTTSGSIAVTALAAVTATVFAIVYAARRPR
ncbi:MULTISPECIES: hypothetical protein [Actinomadura]|uniref:Uncharacterized protein n=1 Tax=Actinomadura yumaensis TaxID=111807 RepID=A0ABW2CKA0_9ACTN|nr:hypothetical protein [Actinomadura sp. J1-007]MWK36930.1 hypothetical protein [Actinomadura sp. J1-007]